MVEVLGSGDSDCWDIYQSIDDEIQALCVHENFDQLVRAIRTAFAKILLDLKCVGRSAERVSFNCRNVP